MKKIKCYPNSCAQINFRNYIKMKKEEKMEDHVDLSVKDIGEELKEKQKL